MRAQSLHPFSNHYDILGRIEFVIDGRSLDKQYSYDTKGQLSWVEDAAGVRKTYYYDGSTGFMFKDTDDSKGGWVRYINHLRLKISDDPKEVEELTRLDRVNSQLSS